jgi:hypothetical protein
LKPEISNFLICMLGYRGPFSRLPLRGG